MGKKRNQDTPEAPTDLEQDTITTTGEEPAEELRAETVDRSEQDPEANLQQELENARLEATRNWDLYLRERAELENFRKRTQRDKEDAIRFANDRLLKEMIPVLDNLERAVEHAEESGDAQQGLLEGVNMTISMFRKALEDFGVKPVPAAGEPFDPNLHQAMGHVETSEQPPNTVVTEFQKGYLLNDRLLRPALVMVAKEPGEDSASTDDVAQPEQNGPKD